jgi:hypothetical protein
VGLSNREQRARATDVTIEPIAPRCCWHPDQDAANPNFRQICCHCRDRDVITKGEYTGAHGKLPWLYDAIHSIEDYQTRACEVGHGE